MYRLKFDDADLDVFSEHDKMQAQLAQVFQEGSAVIINF
jgi:hypothetical protein